MLSKRILVLVSLLLISFLLIGCDWSTPPVIINQAPVITSDPVTTATVGVKYTYDVEATDDDTLTYFLVTKPDGMTINPATGLIKWIPITSQVGYNTVKVEVSDRVESVFQPFTVNVTARIPMTITVDLPTTFTVGESTWFTVEMTANSDLGKEVVASFSGDVGIIDDLEIEEGSGLNFEEETFIVKDATAHFRGTFTSAGTYLITLKVKTTSGKILCSRSFTIVVEGPEVVPLVVGDSYGGGIVAYIDVTGQHGLIAALADATGKMAWSNITVGIGTTGRELGAGQDNTTVIVNQSGCESGAAYYCDNLTVGVYNDWFLPSQDELNKLYINKVAIGGFVDTDYGVYWSSSEDLGSDAETQRFDYGTYDNHHKLMAYYVRAVRYF